MSCLWFAVLTTQVVALAKAGVPVEPGLPPLQNMRRLHADTCLAQEGGTVHIPCLFEESRLAKESHEKLTVTDDNEEQARHTAQAEQLKQAHTAISGLGEL